jgi:hypothetical protein
MPGDYYAGTNFPTGLSLIHVGTYRITTEPLPLKTGFFRKERIDFPELGKQPKHVHGALRAMSFGFGEQPGADEPREVRPISSIYFEMREPELSGNTYSFEFYAIFQDSPDPWSSLQTGKWWGQFDIQILVFG